MGIRLSPCPSCQRHIQITEKACPFCGTATAEGFAATARAPRNGRPLTRAAILFASAAAVAGCSSDDSSRPPTADAATDSQIDLDSGPIALYGPAVIDGGDASAPLDSGLIAAYGPAPIDSGT